MTPANAVPEFLTDRTRKILDLAAAAARRRGGEQVRGEHLLLGLLEEGGGVALAVLHHLGVDRAALERAIELELGTAPAGSDWPMTEWLDRAAAAARELGHFYVGSEHLLAALARGGNPLVDRVFAAHGVTSQAVTAEIGRLLGRQIG